MNYGCAAALLAAALLLTGCGRTALPYAREMGDMALLRTMGVDQEEGDGLRVTVSTGRRAVGLQVEGRPSLALSAERDSLSAACMAIQGLSDSYVFYGYVDQLLVGENLARSGLQGVLDYFSRDAELGLGVQLWMVRGGTARDAVCSGGEAGVDSRLSTLRTDSEMGAAGMTCTAEDVSASLLESGSAYLPALRAEGQEQGEQTALLEAGYGILKAGKLVGYLDGEAARGLELLTGQTRADVLTLNTAAGSAVVRVSRASVRVRPEIQGDAVTGAEIAVTVTANLAEFPETLSPPDLEALRAVLEEREAARTRAALERLQGWNADCSALKNRLGRAVPSCWAALERDWERLFPEMPVEIAVDAVLE